MPRKKQIISEQPIEKNDDELYDEQKPEELQVDNFFDAVSDEFYGAQAWIVDEDEDNQEEREGIGAEGYTPRLTAPSSTDKN